MQEFKTSRPKPSYYFEVEKKLKNSRLPSHKRIKYEKEIAERNWYLSTIRTGQVWMCEQENDPEVYTITSKGINEKTRPMLVNICHGENLTVYPLTTSENSLAHCKYYHKMGDGKPGWCLTEQMKAFSRVKFWYYMYTISIKELMIINNQWIEMLQDPVANSYHNKKELKEKKGTTTNVPVESFKHQQNVSKFGYPLITKTGKKTYQEDLVRDVVDNWGSLPIDALVNKYRNISKADIYNIVEVNFAAR